jgi:competence protein ComEC
MKWDLYPFIRLIIPFTLGMIGANLFVSHMDLVVLFILCCAVLAFSFFFIKTSELYKDGKFGVIAMFLFFLIGMTLHTEKYRHIEQGTPMDTTFCQGILTEAPIEKARSWALLLEQENGVHLLLYIGKDKVAPQHDSITFSTIHIGDTIFANIRHLNATNTCENDTFKTYNTYLFHRGICATAYTPPNQWFVHSCQSSPSLFSIAKSLQGKLHTIYDEHGINGEAGIIIEAMTIGQKSHLSKDIRTAYAHAGVSHVLALSGFHVGIIILIIQFFFLKPLLPLRWQWVSNFFIIAALWLYAFIAGASPSLIRASLMFTILLLCQSFSREAISLNPCAIAFFVMLCINPFYLYDIGFQLSFASILGIGLLSQHFINARTPLILQIIAITFICTLFTAPLVAYHFGSFSTLSIFSNLVLTLFVYLLMWSSILWWAFLWCDPINSFLTDLLNWTATTMNSITEAIASFPFATIEWHPNTLTTILCYTLLLTLTYFFTRHKQFATRL